MHRENYSKATAEILITMLCPLHHSYLCIRECNCNPQKKSISNKILISFLRKSLSSHVIGQEIHADLVKRLVTSAGFSLIQAQTNQHSHSGNILDNRGTFLNHFRGGLLTSKPAHTPTQEFSTPLMTFSWSQEHKAEVGTASLAAICSVCGPVGLEEDSVRTHTHTHTHGSSSLRLPHPHSLTHVWNLSSTSFSLQFD